jgi:hypothetical protein
VKKRPSSNEVVEEAEGDRLERAQVIVAANGSFGYDDASERWA